jgi:hypothetical protein
MNGGQARIRAGVHWTASRLSVLVCWCLLV